jgi:hypothetical protein
VLNESEECSQSRSYSSKKGESIVNLELVKVIPPFASLEVGRRQDVVLVVGNVHVRSTVAHQLDSRGCERH